VLHARTPGPVRYSQQTLVDTGRGVDIRRGEVGVAEGGVNREMIEGTRLNLPFDALHLAGCVDVVRRADALEAGRARSNFGRGESPALRRTGRSRGQWDGHLLAGNRLAVGADEILLPGHRRGP